MAPTVRRGEETDSGGERLGGWLVRRGLIDRCQLYHAIGWRQGQGGRLGDALVALRLLEREVIEREVEAFAATRAPGRGARRSAAGLDPTLDLRGSPLAATIRPRRGRTVALVAGTALLSSLLTLAVTGVVVWAGGGSGGARAAAAMSSAGPPASAPTTESSAGSPASAPPAARPSAAAPAAQTPPRFDRTAAVDPASPGPTSVVLHIVSSPPGARVIDELGMLRGTTPLDYMTPRSTGLLTLTLRRKGYRSTTLSIRPTATAVHRVALRPLWGGQIVDRPKSWPRDRAGQ